MVEVATPSKVCFPLIYIFFEVMSMLGIDEIRGCLNAGTILEQCEHCFVDFWCMLFECPD